MSGKGIRVPVAIFDAKCGLCRRFAAMLRNAIPAEAIDVVPCGSPIQRKLAAAVAAEECSQAFMLVAPDGAVLRGPAAAAAAVALAPSLESYRWMIESKAGRVAASAVYKAASRMRRRKPA